MNVFATDVDPVASAYALDDKRLRKMLVETAQLLCNSLILRGRPSPYKFSHPHHPLTRWAGEDASGRWLYEHGRAMYAEYDRRFARPHRSGDVISELQDEFNSLDASGVRFVNCARNKELDLDFTHLPVHEAYRAYLSARWPRDKRSPIWTNAQPPAWAQLGC